MDDALLSLTHEQQQAAVEEIQKLAHHGIPMGEEIQIIANRFREQQHANNPKKKTPINGVFD